MEDIIENLKEELQMVYADILELAPQVFQEKIMDCTNVVTAQEYKGKKQEFIDLVLNETEVSDNQYKYKFSPTGYCPLCHRGADIQYESGFILPEGMIRHLKGSHGARQCAIIKALDKVAKYYIKLQDGHNA